MQKPAGFGFLGWLQFPGWGSSGDSWLLLPPGAAGPWQLPLGESECTDGFANKS